VGCAQFHIGLIHKYVTRRGSTWLVRPQLKTTSAWQKTSLSGRDDQRYAGSAHGFKATPGASTLTLTLISPCVRRGLTFALVLAVCVGGSSALAVTCSVMAAHAPSEAENAFLHSDYDRAMTLYQAQLQQRPNDPALTVGLMQVFLKQQKVKEADDVVQKALRKIRSLRSC
jgi:Tetratricopeptide repeat